MLGIEGPICEFHVRWWFYILVWKLEGHLIPSIVGVIVAWAKIANYHIKLFLWLL